MRAKMRYDHTEQLQLWLHLCDSLNQEYLSLAFRCLSRPLSAGMHKPTEREAEEQKKKGDKKGKKRHKTGHP